jgi:uncharacterized membrane protein (DUF485 family)
MLECFKSYEQEEHMDEKKKKLKRMATWTIAIFATVFAVAFAVLWLTIYPLSASGMDAIGKVFASGWPILLADAVLCILIYGIYSVVVGGKK